MQFRFLNIKKSRELITSTQQENPFTPNRRTFVKTLGLGTLAFNPVVTSVNALSRQFEVSAKGNEFCILRNKRPVWVISEKIFNPGYKLSVTNLGDGYRIHCENLQYRHSELDFSLDVSIRNEAGFWKFRIRVPELYLSGEADLIAWLDGITEIRGAGTFDKLLMDLNGNDSLSAEGFCECSLDCNWNLKLKSARGIVLNSGGETYSSDLVTVSPLQGTNVEPVKPFNAPGTRLYLPEFNDWAKFAAQVSMDDDSVFDTSNSGSDLQLIGGSVPEGGKVRLVSTQSSWGGIRFMPDRFNGSGYLFDRYFYYAEYLNDSEPEFYFSASLPEAGQWITNDLGAFKLERDTELPDFEASGISGAITGYVLEPRLRAFQPRIENAQVLASVYQDPVNLRINQQKPVRKTVTAPAATTVAPKTQEQKKEEQPQQQPSRTVTTDQLRNRLSTPAKNDTEEKKPSERSTRDTQQEKPAATRPSVTPQRPVRDVKRNIPNLDIEYDRIKFKPQKALKIKVLRPEDMILLEFEFQNFNFTNKGQAPFLELDDAKEPGLVIILFQTQHTLEEAFFEQTPVPLPPGESADNITVKLPVRHIRAKKSRLVYELPAGHDGFPLIMEELLNWSKFKLRVHPRAWIKIPSIAQVKPSNFKIDLPGTIKSNKNTRYLDTDSKEYALRLAQNTKVKSAGFAVYDEAQLDKVLDPEPAYTVKSTFNVGTIKRINLKVGPVDELSTSIEAPTFMYISPNQVNDFQHLISLKFQTTEEGKEVRQELNTQLRILDPLVTNKGEITELWHTRLGVKLSDGKTSLLSLPHFKTIRALWAFDANESYKSLQAINAPFMASLDASDRHILVHTTSNYTEGFTPIPVPVKNLMLTTLGSYLDWHALFDIPTPQDNYLNIIEWEHLATLGRDHYVKVVREGYLFPFGHRAALVKVTERKFHKDTKSAVNRQRMYIVVIEKEVFYDRKDPKGKFIEFPFQVVKIETSRTPDIDNPASSTIINVPPQGNAKKSMITLQGKLGSSGNTSYNFYINVGGKGFNFEIVATDREAKEHTIRMPLAFVENYVARKESLAGQVADKYNANTAYNETSLFGQEIAFAEFLVEGDTAFETESIKFGAQTYPAPGEGDLKFHPKMQEARIYVRPIEELTGSREPVSIGLEDDENAGYVFARVISEAAVDFSGGSDKSGGFLSPNMAVSGLSKLQGPISGKLQDLKEMLFKPLEFFEELEKFPVAKIFGVIKIFDLLLGRKGDPFDLNGSMNGLIDAVKKIREELEEIKTEILYLENLAKETGENIETQLKQLEQQIKDKVQELLDALNNSIPRIPNLKTYATPEAFYAEYKWLPQLESSNIEVIPDLLNVKVNNPSTALSINTKFERPFDTSKSSSINGTARFEKFGIDIVPLLMVNFNYLEFKTGSSQKTGVKVDIDAGNPIQFKGALSFVNNLQSIIPSTGFSEDGPYIKLSPTGVTAGFDLSIPNVTVGICMITNMSLGAAVTLPFTGAPLTLSFNFCTRENPFLLTVTIYGGGGYFLLVSTLHGIQSIEAAFEFGAAVSLDVGVASGGVSVMGGFYFKLEKKTKTITKNGKEEEIDYTEINLAGYIRINGHLCILGLITISLEFYLALEAKFVGSKCEKLEGVATLKVKVEVLFFSKTVSVSVRKQLKGADADPKFGDVIDLEDWQEYCLAFAN